jgi:hypothetical protein
MKIVQTILQQIGKISKPQQKFMLVLFSTIFIVCGKVTFTNLSRYSQLSEKTYRRQFGLTLDFQHFNQCLIEQAIAQSARKIAAIDCSFIPKSGKLTYGKDYFFNGCAGKPEKGLEISVITVVDVDVPMGYTLSVQQTPAQKQPTTPQFPSDNQGAKSAKSATRAATKAQKSTKRKKSTKSLQRGEGRGTRDERRGTRDEGTHAVVTWD